MNGYITKRQALSLGLSRKLLDTAIASGQIRHVKTGLNRTKVLRADVMKIMGIGITDTPRAA